ncbi:MAG TPA: hypothetical protein VGC65_02630 [Bacteroidia bacterium]|jgi:hypothetical protein
MQKKLYILGIVSIILGLGAALLCFAPYGIFLSLPIGFLGMICSTIYVYFDTKNSINKSKFTPGIFGMILSSIPILIVLYIIVMGSLSR